MRSYAVALKSAMPCCTALRTTSFDECSQCRMPQRGWSLAFSDLSTSHQSCARCTGYPSVSESRSSWQRLSIVLERPGPDVLGYDFCRQTGDRRSGMRSAETWILHAPCARSMYSDRSFAVTEPTIWNSMPPVIRDLSLSSQRFRRLLNLFG